jgi:hypothetical protein
MAPGQPTTAPAHNGSAPAQHQPTVAQQNGSAPAPAASNGHDHSHSGRYDEPIGPDEVYDQEADEAAYNEAMYPATPEEAPSPGKKEHVA